MTPSVELAVAVNENAGSPKVLVGMGLKLIVWDCLTVSNWVTGAAALRFAFPGCAAVIVAVPAPTIVKMLPETEATAVLLLV